MKRLLLEILRVHFAGKRFQEMDRTVPVIMVTASANARIAEDCLQGGAFSWERGPHR
jgi:CheY-like chemotaxis protein